MERVCLLDPEINRCQYKGEGKKCDAPHSTCGMMIKLKEEPNKTGYVRQPRWYEQYYK